MAGIKYNHIFFDLDHTLWDYEANAREALEELYGQYDLGKLGLFSSEELIRLFFEINEQLWDEYNHHRIDKNYIRKERFKIIFDQLRVPLRHFPTGFGEDYINLCPTKTNTIEYAREVLEYLQQKYNLHIITNGFNDIQGTKLSASKLDTYFQEVITSESIGARKPSSVIFQHALSKAGASPDESIMIGDNYKADILGALNAGIDQVYYNPVGNGIEKQPTYIISQLIQLKDIL